MSFMTTLGGGIEPAFQSLVCKAASDSKAGHNCMASMIVARIQPGGKPADSEAKMKSTLGLKCVGSFLTDGVCWVANCLNRFNG